MDPDLRREIDEIKALTKDNHRMLRAIRRDYWIGLVGKVIIWIIVLALPLYLYQQYIQPIVTKIVPTATTTGMFGISIPSSAEVEKLLNSYKSGQ